MGETLFSILSDLYLYTFGGRIDELWTVPQSIELMVAAVAQDSSGPGDTGAGGELKISTSMH